LTAASERLTGQLTLNDPRQKQFAAKSESWITTYLAPDWSRGWDRGLGGRDRN